MTFEERICPACKEDTLYENKLPDTSPHFSEIKCAACGRHIKFNKKPQNKEKRPTNKRLKPEIDYCEICLRHHSKIKSWIEEHHILEYRNHPELDKEKTNRLVVCKECHDLIHTIRKLVSNG